MSSPGYPPSSYPSPTSPDQRQSRAVSSNDSGRVLAPPALCQRGGKGTGPSELPALLQSRAGTYGVGRTNAGPTPRRVPCSARSVTNLLTQYRCPPVRHWAGGWGTKGHNMPKFVVEALLCLLDDAFEGNEEHSLLGNLATVHDDDWLWTPAGGSRSIRDLVAHAGTAKDVYA